MTTTTQSTVSADERQAPANVDPRAPRFGQALTATGLAAGVALGEPALVALVAAALLVAVASRWQLDPYALLWRHLVAPRLAPAEPEPAAPHRFAKLLGAAGTALATVLLLAGAPLAGYAVAATVALAAGLAAATDVCIGCRMYRGVALFRRLNLV